MPITTIFDTDTTFLARKAGEFLQEKCSSLDCPLLLLISGGSALDILQDVTLPSSHHITLGVVDERYSGDLLENNFLQLSGTEFFMRAQQSGVACIDMSPQDSETLSEFAERMDMAIENWEKENYNGKIYAVLGVGVDGHIAGIMPFGDDAEHFNELFEKSSSIAVGYDAGDKNSIPQRVTVTLPFLRTVNEAIVYAVGDNKAPALRKVFTDEGTLAATPARILKEMKSVTLFTNTIL